MSRIQDILARAERDGTARRTQSIADATAHAAAADRVDVIDARTLFPRAAPPPGGAIDEPPPPGVTSAPQPRCAQATLHASLIAAVDPQSAAAEQYRAVRTRLAAMEESAPVRVVLVTSPAAREGKSVTAANLALTMAQEAQRRVLLVDADLRTPALDHLFGIDGSPGLVDVLTGAATLDEALVYVPEHRLTVLPSGGRATLPADLLGSTVMRRTIDTLRARFDRVLLDLPPVLPLADVGTVAPLADGVILVVRAGATQRPAFEQALGAFTADRVLGVVLNGAS